MPKVTKQIVGSSTKASNGKTGSVIDRITPIYFNKDLGIRVVLYGQSGTGKTTTWATFPGPILAMICSGGNQPGELLSINTPEYAGKVSQVVIENSSDVFELIKHIKDTGRFKTVVLDHATGLQDLVLKEILGMEEIPVQKTWGMARQQDYGTCTIRTKEILRALFGIQGNIVVIAQEREFKSEEGLASELIAPYVGANLMPNLAGWLNSAADYICQTFKRPKEKLVKHTVAGKEVTRREVTREVEYCLRTAADPVYMTKFRVPKGKPLPNVIVDPDYDKIVKIIRGG